MMEDLSGNLAVDLTLLAVGALGLMASAGWGNWRLALHRYLSRSRLKRLADDARIVAEDIAATISQERTQRDRDLETEWSLPPEGRRLRMTFSSQDHRYLSKHMMEAHAVIERLKDVGYWKPHEYWHEIGIAGATGFASEATCKSLYAASEKIKADLEDGLITVEAIAMTKIETTYRAMHEKNGKGERIMSRKQIDNRFWRIKKGEPIPEWLEKGATAAGMVAGDDLIVIPSETEGYDVYPADPNSSGPMIKVTAENIHEVLSITGAPTCFRMANSLHYTIGTLQKENEALNEECDASRETIAQERARAEAAEAKLAEAMKELKSIEEKSAQTAYGSDHTICYTCAENLEQVHKFLKENGNGE